ncbi:MAG: 3-deoxy-D-manno-octulosonic acid transferase [Paracoccus denitrificans]|nr:MAG: 3-deoxy-D-manno-octulosonic acid transferase [Paracoccus denitrificans]PZO83996.1 MAG: 3-deoxy-D-manno-octulosonic acid transferase [Paracoccus denitrificans]
MAGVGDLALWLNLRGTRQAPGQSGPSPGGAAPATGPLILIHGAAGFDGASALSQALETANPDVRLATIGGTAASALPQVAALADRVPADLNGARGLLSRERPAALLLMGDELPAALVAAAYDAHLPITIVANRLPATGTGWWSGGVARRLLVRAARVFVADGASRDEALTLGVAPQRVEIVGVLERPLTPLRCNVQELSAIHAQVIGRHVWHAASLPLDEAQAVIDAQAAVMAFNHRALLIVSPAEPTMAEPIAALADAAGLTVARRWMDEEPTRDVQLLVAEDLYELGLWYRVASVSYMGGTLGGAARATSRDPFEAAALGSSIIHGPQIAGHPRAWRMLDNAHAARRVPNAAGLAAAAADLTAADQAARLAQAAWGIGSNGAAVARRIAQAVLSDIGPAKLASGTPK